MPTAYHENCTKPVESKPESSREMYNRKKKRGFLKRSKTVHSQSAPNSPQPERRTKTVAGSNFPEPRYNKSVNLLIEAKRLAREVEERKEKGELFRNVYRSSLNYGRKASSRYYGGGHSGRSISQEDGGPGSRDSSPFLRAELLRAKAELRQSLSQDRPEKELPVLPIRCEECGRDIKDNLFSEHRGKAYCNVPCYSMLFSPLTSLLYNKASNDGDLQSQLAEDQKKLRNALVPKLRVYNTYYAEKPSQVCCKEVDDQFILSGILKVYWGLKRPVTLRATDSSYWNHVNPENGLKREYPYNGDIDEVDGKSRRSRPVSMTRSSGNKTTLNSPREQVSTPTTRVSSPLLRVSSPPPIVNGDMSTTRRRRAGTNMKRRNSRMEKTSFVPPYGTPTTLRLTNKVQTPDVVKMLLNKFQISDKAEKFTLFIVYESGGVRKLKEEDMPILVRVNLGPCEDVAKIFIMERADQMEIPNEVAQFGKFAMHELENFLIKYKEEEEREVDKLKERYRKYRQVLEERMSEIEKSSPVTRL